MSAGGIGARAGLYGKLPARGDFVRAGLPRDFVEPWDSWWQRGISASRALAGDDWTPAWLVAPVWRFVLPPGLLGRGGVLGLWMPSVDRAGRHFPLTIAAVAPFDWTEQPSQVGVFLEVVEEAGRDALAQDLEPERVLRRVEAALDGQETPREPGVPDLVPGRAAWWTEGGPRVAARLADGFRLPEGATFAALLDDRWAASAEDA
ncbi:type VI secretion system-associated protein TagF [Roseomonas xinghualingensis]|uniref:type VI secretion system-associated protein TagF n=1 Tax=Roseomonas xinghualingensis TaxID=2986475 RepID=UPI0021F10BF1|nr:type VI secretion system-associated protein TagF [Roseomonas sp. SXEYE001]MCV4209660.1 type VI secretion system-associated protein TagF [Roseomonas sp. SXEYE001]